MQASKLEEEKERSLGVLLGSAGAGGTNIYQLAPIDQCQTETVLRWCSTSDVYGRKLLLHVGLGGMAACIMIEWFAASRFNHLGPNIYYLEVVAVTLMPATLCSSRTHPKIGKHVYESGAGDHFARPPAVNDCQLWYGGFYPVLAGVE
ncbi:hypothetical protein BGX24_006948 [Mortierella sp. AD032]|nr:hypothetical protein BGX24_006948 [Mortierella sp. AD032]